MIMVRDGEVVPPKVSIVILNWNGIEDTVECLESLSKIDYSNYDVIVVDQGSECNDATILKERFGDTICLIGNEKNHGFAGGNNIGIRYAFEESHPDYVMLLNSDTVVDSSFLTKLVEVAQSEEIIGAVQSKLLRKDNPETIDSAGQEVYSDGSIEDIGIESPDDGRFDTVHEIFGPCAAAALYKTSVLNEVGLFDERFFVIAEDIDLSWRMRLSGFKTLLVPGSLVYHTRRFTRGISSAPSSGSVRAYYSRKNCLALVIKYYPLRLIFRFLPLFCISFLVAAYYSRRIDHGGLVKDLMAAFNDRKSRDQYGVAIKEVQREWIIPRSLINTYIYYLLRFLRMMKLL